jgi:hypothetical protein
MIPARKGLGLNLFAMLKLIILFVSLSVQSCSSAKVDSSIYSIGKEYYYKVVKSDSANNLLYSDTLIMRIEKSGFLGLFNQKKAYWYSIDAENEGEHWRGFTDDGEILEIQVPIHIADLSKLTIAPYPYTMVPPKEGYKITSTHTFAKGYGEQTGKTIEQKITIGEKESCSSLGKSRECWRIEGRNTSLIEEEGLYTMTALFESANGFVEWSYTYPNATTVVLKLVAVK